MIMAYAFDFALLFISTCSAFYCWTLSRRLHALQNLRKGVGQAMVNLTKSVSAVETNAVKLNREAMAAVSELRIMLAKVDDSEEKVDLLLQTMDQQARETWREYKNKTSEATETLDQAYKALSGSLDEARELVRLVETKSAQLKKPESAPERETPAAAPGAEAAPAARKSARPAAERPTISGNRDMSAREVALARALAAQRAKEKAAAAPAAGPQDDLDDYTAKPAAAMPPADDAVASFARRLRQKQGRTNPFHGSEARRAKA